MASTTMTSVLHTDPTKTMTQELHDAAQSGETMSQTAHRLVTEANGGGTPPAVQAPSGFAKPTSSNVTATGFKVTWTAPTSGDPVDNYIVAVSTGGTPITGSPFTMSGTTLSKTVSGLTTGTDYDVVVTAVNAGGQANAPALTVTTA